MLSGEILMYIYVYKRSVNPWKLNLKMFFFMFISKLWRCMIFFFVFVLSIVAVEEKENEVSSLEINVL